jgi:mannosyltransferase
MIHDDIEIEEWAPWLVTITTLVGFGLRVFLIANKGLWLDEALSMWVSNHTVVDMLPWIANIDHHPPLYYLLLHYWITLNGNTASDLRMLSAIFGAATIPIIYLIGKRMSGVAMGLAAAVFLAVSPFNIRFGQEARMYTLLTFNAAVAIFALVRLLTDSSAVGPIGSQFREYLRAWRLPGPVEPDTESDFSYKIETHNPIVNQIVRSARTFRRRWVPIQTIETDLAWVVFVVFSAATMLSHNTAVLFPIATNIFVLGLMLYQRIKKSGSLPAFQAPSFWNWVKSQVGIFLLWSPWLLAFIKQASRVYQEFWIPAAGWDTIVQTLRSFLNETVPGQSSLEMMILILYALVLCLGLAHSLKKFSQFLFLAVLFAIPFLGELVVSIRRPVFLDRTLIWTTIPLFLVLAAGIVQLRFRLLMLVVVGILATNNLFSTSDYYRFVQKEDWSYASAFVAKFVTNDDLVLFNAPRGQIVFDYYFRKWEEQYFIKVEKHGVPVDMFDSGVLDPRMTNSDIPRLISLLSGHKTVWLVYSYDAYTDPMGLIPQTLASQMKFIGKRDFYGVQVQVYAAP